jgi:aminotransferase
MGHLSKIALNYPASGIRRMFDLAAKYDDAIKLTLGEPNFDTPANIKQAAKKAIDDGFTHYNPNAGLLELREVIADYYNKYSKQYSFENVMVTVGALEALTLSLMTTVDPGDEVIVPDPCFPNYIGQIMLVGAIPVSVPVYEENNFKIRAGDIQKAVTPSTKGIVLNSPSNPLGSVLDRAEVERIAQVAEEHDLLVYSDECYDRLLYDGQEYFSMAQLPQAMKKVLVINSLSKTYAMTGWRIGFVIGDQEIISNMPKIQEGIVSCVSTFTQKAAIEALTGPQTAVDDMVANYRRRRDILIDGLNGIPGFKCNKSPGSFYAFANIKEYGKTSMEFAEELIRGARVVTVPGSAFGKMGEGYLRLVFANSDENLKEAVRRIAGYIRETY